MQNPTTNNDDETPPQTALEKAKKVAIYHKGALGDLLVSSAAIYESIQCFPNAEFTIMGSKLWKEIINPQVWKQIKFILEIQNKKFTEFRLWRPSANNLSWEAVPFDFPNLGAFLKSFDATIDFRTESLRFAWRALLAKVPIRVGGSTSKFAKIFFTHFAQEKPYNTIHERDRYLEVLLSLNSSYIQERMTYWKQHGLPHLHHVEQDLQQKKSILINPTASIREKAWPSEKYRQLALKLKAQGNHVLIIGAPTETRWLKEVSSEDFQTVQPKTIFQLIQMVSQAKLLITNTSSMQFVAASTKTPTLTLMGLAQSEIWGPLGEWSSYLKGKGEKLSKNIFTSHNKMRNLNEVLSYNSISVEDVLSHIHKYFDLIQLIKPAIISEVEPTSESKSTH